MENNLQRRKIGIPEAVRDDGDWIGRWQWGQRDMNGLERTFREEVGGPW